MNCEILFLVNPYVKAILVPLNFEIVPLSAVFQSTKVREQI